METLYLENDPATQSRIAEYYRRLDQIMATTTPGFIESVDDLCANLPGGWSFGDLRSQYSLIDNAADAVYSFDRQHQFLGEYGAIKGVGQYVRDLYVAKVPRSTDNIGYSGKRGENYKPREIIRIGAETMTTITAGIVFQALHKNDYPILLLGTNDTTLSTLEALRNINQDSDQIESCFLPGSVVENIIVSPNGSAMIRSGSILDSVLKANDPRFQRDPVTVRNSRRIIDIFTTFFKQNGVNKAESSIQLRLGLSRFAGISLYPEISQTAISMIEDKSGFDANINGQAQIRANSPLAQLIGNRHLPYALFRHPTYRCPAGRDNTIVAMHNAHIRLIQKLRTTNTSTGTSIWNAILGRSGLLSQSD